MIFFINHILRDLKVIKRNKILIKNNNIRKIIYIINNKFIKYNALFHIL